jgi:hypothetical protein
MNERIRDYPWRWSRAFVVAFALCFTMMLTGSPAHPCEMGEVLRDDPKAPAEVERMFAWAVARLDAVRAWENRIAAQEKSIERISDRIGSLTKKIAKEKFKITDDFKLCLMPSISDAKDIPKSGKNLVIVARLNGSLHFRVFDGEGRITDGDAKAPRATAERIAELERRLGPLAPGCEVPRPERDPVILGVNLILRLNDTKYFDLLPKARRKIDVAETELAVATALSESLPPYRAQLVIDSAAVTLEHARLEWANLERWGVQKEVADAKANIVTLNDQLEDLNNLKDEEHDKLVDIKSMAGMEQLTDTEVEIIKLLKAYVSERDANKPVPAEKSLAAATRLWRQAMERQFKSRVQANLP